jgi:flagellar protein FlaH
MPDEEDEQQKETRDIISTGHNEIDRKLGGGIPVGSLTLIDGQSDAGKSVLCQQLMWGSLNTGFKVILFTTENTTKSLVSQTDSLGLGILDHLLLGGVKVFYMKPSQVKESAHDTFETILETVNKHPAYELVVVDSLTPIISTSRGEETLGYFERCKHFCDRGRTIVNVIHTYALNSDILIRVRSACDAHLILTIEKVGDKLVKSLEVAKIRGASQSTGNVVAFEVEPAIGMKIMPMSRAKA